MTNYRTQQALIAMIRRVQSARGRRQAGLFSIEGTRLIERALRADAPLEAVLVADSLIRSDEPRARELQAALQLAGCEIAVAPDDLLRELTEGRDLGLILGLVRLPPAHGLADVLRDQGLSQQKPPLLLAAIDIVDPGNVGALTRTAHAGGAIALAAAGVSDPYHSRATRISRGSIFRLPIITCETAGSLLADLRHHGIAAAGTVARGGTPLPDVTWPRTGSAILMGNEAEGLPPGIEAALDVSITIPMPDDVDSYSVNAAAAIILYAAARSRKT